MKTNTYIQIYHPFARPILIVVWIHGGSKYGKTKKNLFDYFRLKQRWLSSNDLFVQNVLWVVVEKRLSGRVLFQGLLFVAYKRALSGFFWRQQCWSSWYCETYWYFRLKPFCFLLLFFWQKGNFFMDTFVSRKETAPIFLR